MFHWLRRYIRRNYKPIDPDHAMQMKTKLSIAYALISWNLLGLVIYTFTKDSFPKENSPAEYAKLLGIRNATVIKYEGLKRVEEYDLHVEIDDSDREHWLDEAKKEL